MPIAISNRRGRTLCATALALTLSAASVVVPLGPAFAASALVIQRTSGPDRYATAAAIARTAYPDGAGTVLVASGETFPDALAATSLAGTSKAPVLLTRASSAPEATVSALRALRPRRVVLVGGTARISGDVAGQLASAAGISAPQRISGPDRYATATQVVATLPLAGVGRVDGQRTALLATGEKFPDALAAGSVAAAAGLPLLLTPPDALPQGVGDALTRAGVTQVVLLGGEASVSAGVADALGRQGVSTVRLGGVDRQATAATVADWALVHAGMDPAHAALARGDAAGGGADALALGPLAALRRAPVVLAESPGRAGAATTSWVASHGSTLKTLDVAGGRGAVSDDVVEEMRRAAASGPQAPARAGNGSLALTISGLPSGTAAVGISGPGGYYARAAGTTTLTGLAEGSYRLVAEPVHQGADGAGTTAFAAPVPSVVVGAGTTAVTISYGTQVPDTTEVVPTVAVQAVEGPRSGARTLTVDTAVAPTLAVGEIAAVGSTSAEPAGVLGKVVARQQSGTSTRLTLQPVDLREAVPVADFDATLSGDLVDTTTAAAATAPQGTLAASKSPSFWKPECSRQGPEASLESKVSLAPVFMLDAEWDRARVKSLDTSVGLTGTTSLTAEIMASASCSAEDQVKLENLSPLSFMVGWLPVVLLPEVALNRSYTAKVDAGAKVSVASTTRTTFGRRWSAGTWTPHSEVVTTDEGSFEGPSATGVLEATVGPQFTLLVYGVAGPYASLTGEGFATVSTQDPVWAVDVAARANVGLASPVFGLDKGIVEIPILKKKRVAKAKPLSTKSVCTDVAACREVASVDVDGDGKKDDVALVGETPRAGTVIVRVKTATTVLTTSVDYSNVGDRSVWKGSSDIDGVPGAELVILETAGAHVLVSTVLTVRDRKLVILPSPDEITLPDGEVVSRSWTEDGAVNYGAGITCSLDKTVTISRFTGLSDDTVKAHQSTYRWRVAGWDVVRDSGEQEISRDAITDDYYGWRCEGIKKF